MSAVGMQCAVCGCWDGDGEPANNVVQYEVIRVWADHSERTAGETPGHMWLCDECAEVDPIIDSSDLFGNEERVYLA